MNLEDLELEMIVIPGGTFLMGSPEGEKRSRDRERPQHEVIIKPFLMGKYPIIQTQWQAVAALEKVNIDLKSDPSYFKGDDLPVESVSWSHAQEFCARLSRMANKAYRLPTEAQWEYACRAGTTTPFYFGETITTELANYDGNYTYGDGLKGVDCQQTTDVGTFPPNAFGLHDMHGNVWEWCQDTWHENYVNAPEDGSDCISQVNSNRVLRGGSWYNIPGNCRSASRNYNIAGFGNNGNGFRVVCDV
ncbi:MAG: formylglycine-generating enzyme family protein [Dolichospermum sp.]